MNPLSDHRSYMT